MPFFLLFAPPLFAQGPDLVRQIGIGPVQAAIILGLFLCLFIFNFAKPVYGLIVMICYYPFITGSTALGLPQIIAGILIVQFLLLWLQRRLVWRSLGKAGEDYSRVKTVFLAFWVYVIANSINASLRGTPPIDIIRDLAPWSGLAMFLFMETFVRKEKDLILVRNVQIAVMAIISLYVLQWFIPALRPLFGILNIKSSFLGILAILLIGAAGIVFKLMPRWFSLGLCMVSGAYFLFTPTRTHFVVALFAIVAMIVVTARRRRGLVLALAVGLFSYGAYNVINRYMEPVLHAKEQKFQMIYEHGLDPSVQSRLDEIVHAWGLFSGSPVIGIGAGHRYQLWRHWVRSLKGPGIYYDNFLHSDFMNFLAKLGMLGVILYFYYYYKISRIAWSLWTRTHTDTAKASGLICFLLLMSALIAGQSTPMLQSRSDCLFLGFVMGYAYCSYRIMKSNGRDTLVDIRSYSLKYS